MMKLNFRKNEFEKKVLKKGGGYYLIGGSYLTRHCIRIRIRFSIFLYSYPYPLSIVNLYGYFLEHVLSNNLFQDVF